MALTNNMGPGFVQLMRNEATSGERKEVGKVVVMQLRSYAYICGIKTIKG